MRSNVVAFVAVSCPGPAGDTAQAGIPGSVEGIIQASLAPSASLLLYNICLFFMT
jgi:hypothetical protein